MRTGSSSARRAFLLLFAGETVNTAGTWVSTVALPLVAVSALHATAFEVGLLEAVQWAPALLIGLPVGALVDRGGPRRLMMAANLGQAAATGAVPVTAALGVLSMPVLLLAASAAGFFGVFFRTAVSPYIREIVAADDLLSANARLQAGQSAAKVAGPSLGGGLVATLGAPNAVVADAVSFLVSFLTLWAIGPSRATAPARERRPMGAEISDGLRYLRGSPLLLKLTAWSALANFFLTAIGAIEIVFLVRAVHVSAATVGLLLTISGTGGLIGALLADRLAGRRGMRALARAAIAATAPFAALIPLTHPGVAIALFAVGGLVASLGIALASVAFRTLIQLECASEMLGRVIGASWLLSSASIPAGAVLGGGLGQALGTRTALLAVAVGYVGFGLAVLATPLRAST